jgi:DnaK suppressor protein
VYTELEHSSFLKVLQGQKIKLEELLEATRDSARPVELDQTKVGRLSRMDAMQSQAMAKETQRRRKLDLQRVDAAIKRIKNSDYGFCCVCDELIPKKRLEFDPATTTCVGCAQKGASLT